MLRGRTKEFTFLTEAPSNSDTNKSVTTLIYIDPHFPKDANGVPLKKKKSPQVQIRKHHILKYYSFLGDL